MMFIFIFQSIWLFIDDLAGKGLDIAIIGKFFFYKMPELTEKVLPLTVLLSSILTFGSFAENYEFAAMKASGISLQRAMISIIVFIFFLGGLTFFFANSVIPASEQKIFNLRRNIAKLKPAVAITEGIFSDFESADMNIKVDKKYGENDRFLKNIIIHQKTKSNINYRVIKAKDGELISGGDSDIIQLVLKDGHLYQTVEKRGTDRQRYPFANSQFETYTMNIDLTELNNVDLEEERDIETAKMKNISRLRKDVDSLSKDNLRIVTAFSKNILVTKMGAFGKEKPSSIEPTVIENARNDSIQKQLKENDGKVENILSLYPDWQQLQVLNAATNTITNALNTVKAKRTEMGKRYELHRRHIFSFHDKFALAFSCIILFFVGAPLGAIIRKGGLGLPMVIAIVLFLVYYFVGVFAENYSNKGNIHPILGAWTSTLLMLPLGILLTKRATADKGLMSFGRIIDFFKKTFGKKNDLEEEVEDLSVNHDSHSIDENSIDYQTLSSYSDERLIEMGRKRKQFRYDPKFSATIFAVLDSRGITQKQLKISGQIDNSQYEKAKAILLKYNKNSYAALVFYLLYIASYIVSLTLVKLELFTLITNITLIASLILFTVFLIKSIINYYTFRKELGKKEDYVLYILLFGGIPIYFLVYFYTKKKLNEELNTI